MRIINKIIEVERNCVKMTHSGISFIIRKIDILSLQHSVKALRTLVLYMTKDWNATVNKRDRKTMLDVANITRKLSIGSTVFVLTVGMFYLMFRFSAIRQTGRQLLFHAYFPYNATSSPCYELTLFGQFAGAMYAATTYTVVDTFIATLVLHICGQLSNLRYELTNLYAYTKAEFQTKLGNIVRKHEYLNR